MAVANTFVRRNAECELTFSTKEVYLLVHHYHEFQYLSSNDNSKYKEAYTRLDDIAWLAPMNNTETKEAIERGVYARVLSPQAKVFVESLGLAPKPESVLRWVIPSATQDYPNVLYYNVGRLNKDGESISVWLKWDDLTDPDEKKDALAGKLPSMYKSK